MGDRVSISFKRGDSESIALFDHWGGIMLVEEARRYAFVLRAEVAGKQVNPLDRLEPGTVMVDFIRHLVRNDGPRLQRSLYVGKMSDPMWGDNSDNGHHIISLDSV